ncbi:unnamed protein product [Oppiella nova]|uniref:Rho-GAP domain-containing protein n=1 Tax=Oppiella nova TaxID=334625 RepID=A0A7R9QSP4_9ACAR|nr:unnamed protein product [Oppiella nova]CAG2172493.1 unnamed protein product [Oppiella nova]
MNQKQKFPKIQDSKHFHYNYVRLSTLSVHPIVVDDTHVVCRVTSGRSWTIRRSLEQFRRLDALLHACVLSRDFSRLSAPIALPDVHHYCQRLNAVFATDVSALNCLLLLNWLECDNSGHHIICDESEVNCRSIGAAFVVKHFETSRALNAKLEVLLSLEIGDLVSIIEFDAIRELDDNRDDTQTTTDTRLWSKGKKGVQVGFFPSECVQVIDRNIDSFAFKVLATTTTTQRRPDDDSRRPTSPLVWRKSVKKDNKISAFFHKWRPARLQLEFVPLCPPQVFGADLCEHLFDSRHEIPEVLRICTQFIERRGFLDGIYRLSGIASNIAKLRQTFEEEETPDLEPISDVHCVSSLLKLYFRSLPNPLLTFHLYDAFVAAIRDTTAKARRLSLIRRLVARLPPPHARTLFALMRHLNLVSKAAHLTGMTAKNLAIVWAPNLLRSRDLDNHTLVGDLAALQVIGTQAVLTEYLIANFDDVFAAERQPRPPKRSSCRHSTSFCRRMSQKQRLIRCKSFNSFFAKTPKDVPKEEFFLKFAETQTLDPLVERVAPQFSTDSFGVNGVHFATQWRHRRPVVSTCAAMALSSVRVTDAVRVCNDVTEESVSRSQRERIERIKAERRLQLRQQFDSKPTPTPRKTTGVSAMAAKWRQIAPKVDTRRAPQTTPVPTPRRRSLDVTTTSTTTTTTTSRTTTAPTLRAEAPKSSQVTITALKTKGNKRNNSRKAFESNFI